MNLPTNRDTLPPQFKTQQEFQAHLDQISAQWDRESNIAAAQMLATLTGESEIEAQARIALEESILEAATSRHPEARLAQVAKSFEIPLDVAKSIAFDLMRTRLNVDPEEKEFQRMVHLVKAAEKIQDAGYREWRLQCIARSFKRSKKELMEAYNKALIHQAPIKPLKLSELKAIANTSVKWLVQGWIPLGVAMLFHAFGGTGKTLFMYQIAACIAKGKPWNEYPVEQGHVLVLQSDEPAHVTHERLETLGITDTDPLDVFPNWQVEAMPQLEAFLQAQQDAGKPVRFVLIDSATSCNRNTMISENDVEYARPVLQLAALAEKFGFTCVVIHHSNAMGEARGTKALHNSVSEVWAMSVANEMSGERLLRVQKNRVGRPPGRYKFDFDPATYEFTFTGEEGEREGESATNEKQIELWLQEESHRGIPYESEEIAHELRLSKSVARRALYELWSKGVIRREKRKRAFLYWVGDLRPEHQSDHLIASDHSDPASDHLGDHFAKHEGIMLSDLSDQVITQNGHSQQFKNAVSSDHLITSPESMMNSEPPSDHLSDHLPIASDQVITSQVVAPLPSTGDLVIINATATWYKRESDRLPYRDLPPSIRSQSAIPVNKLHGPIFHELIDISEVIGYNRDRTRVKVRNQQTGRTSVFNAGDVVRCQ